MAMSRFLGVACAAWAVLGSDPTPDNMNGDYILSETPNAHDTQKLFPTHFKDYPRPVESFELYSPPIVSLYSQVFWKGLDPVDLPEEIVKKYDGKGMAVVGFEMDQVRRTPDGDVSVPITVAYNHHFESQMTGAKSRMEKITFDGPDDPRIAKYSMGHGIPSHKEHWVVKDLAPGNSIPTSQAFGGANGGEYRKSFHGYAPGYAQVIESPRQFHITPMQIDTWNRDKMNLTYPSKMVSGPVPRSTLAPIDGPDALYSGLLECPLTTRVRKVIQGGYSVRLSGNCDTSIETSSECFAAAASTLGAGVQSKNVFNNTAGSDASMPPGCSATVDETDPNNVNVFFNTISSSDGASECGGGAGMVAGATESLVNVSIGIDSVHDTVTITLSGPKDVWFGVGFNASAMKDAPWAIIVEGTGNVTERKLQDQNPGKQLAPSVKVVSSKTEGSTRTVVLTRALKGASSDYYTFDPNVDVSLPFINAVGNGPTLAYHKDKTPSGISLLPITGAPGACVCAEKPAPFGEGKGQLVYVPTSQPGEAGSGSVGFGNKCAPQPRSDLLKMKNPTCDVRSYVGGQTACHHMWSLLDADQDIPWPNQPLNYSLKFRFYVQEYNETYHQNLKRTTWGIASPVEFDVPKCEEGVMGCSRGDDGTWVHTITGTYTGGGKLAAAHFHCHAPTCLSVQMYRCNKSVEVCNATTGELLCREDPVYGGTGKIDQPKFDEPGYILQPPCLWGSSEFGLEEPVDTTGYTLHSVKTSNATYGHHGEMAWQQMYVF